jgi:hypothetical protein
MLIKPKAVVVTGASSPIGVTLVNRLIKSRLVKVVALCSGRSIVESEIFDKRIDVMYCDLSGSIPGTIAAIVKQADFLFHLAWIRKKKLSDAKRINEGVLEKLLILRRPNSGLLFLSSVAASPSTRSIYGSAKYHVMQKVVDADGIVFVSGLVKSDPPFGPDALLKSLVSRLPFRVRFRNPDPMVYSVALEDLIESLIDALGGSYLPGIYRQFSEPQGLNQSLIDIERGRGVSKRKIMTFNTIKLVRTCFWLRETIPNSPLVLDKIITFLDKDDYFLGRIRCQQK